VVEAQHAISTLKLVDTLAEQALLEQLLEASKPPVPPECRPLHYLLSTPFRYGAPYPFGSRFRRAGLTPGVFYASHTAATAIAETAFHRLLFFADSPDTPWPVNAGEFTAFAVRIRTTSGLDLTSTRFDQQASAWLHPTDYSVCQDLADAARAAAVQAIRYRSARDAKGVNIAVLVCLAFASREPLDRQTWRMHLGASGVQAICNSPLLRLEFERSAFAQDPRIAAVRWER
jgi:hypothetical protein